MEIIKGSITTVGAQHVATVAGRSAASDSLSVAKNSAAWQAKRLSLIGAVAIDWQDTMPTVWRAATQINGGGFETTMIKGDAYDTVVGVDGLKQIKG